MTDELRVGVIGLGSVFEPYAESMRRLRAEGRIRVVRTCDVNPERSDAGERLLAEPAPFSTDYSDVISDPRVEAVVILTSMPAHGRITLEALRAGKHVLVEKPMSVEMAGAEAIMEETEKRDSVLMCAPGVVLSPTFQAIWKRVIHQGEIGRIHLARGRYGWSGPDWGQWFYRPGGGPVFDLAVYNITALTGWLGPVRRVTAMAGIAHPRRVVDGEEIEVEVYDNYQILLDFGDAAFGVVTTGFTMERYRSPALELYGSEGTIQMLGDDWAPEGYEMWTNDLGAWAVYEEIDPRWDWTGPLEHLLDVVGGATQLIQPRHAFHVLEIMLAADRAAATGATQDLVSNFDPIAFDVDSIYLSGVAPVHDRRIIRTEEHLREAEG
ncbi:MAG: Gfo/Idh/MocA family oxidoreductase [Acidimicrobiia bacterium]|nr:Gfo/Idh/MocA family oxidoreductase [Acidimicrobiia bacterium]